MDGCLAVVKFFCKSLLPQFFGLILTTVGTYDLCANAEKMVDGFSKFCFKNFWRIFQISNWDLLCRSV